MAITVTSNTTEVFNMEGTSDNGGTWAAFGSASAITANGDIFKVGSGGISAKLDGGGGGARGGMVITRGTGIDFEDADGNLSGIISFWAFTTSTLSDTADTGGITLRVGSDSTSWREWQVAKVTSADKIQAYPGGWQRYVVDLSTVPTATNTTIDTPSSVDYFVIQFDVTTDIMGNIQTIYIDEMNCLTASDIASGVASCDVTGTVTTEGELFKEIAESTVGLDEGIAIQVGGVVALTQPIELGDDGTGSSTLTSQSEQCVWQDFHIKNGAYFLRFAGNSTGTSVHDWGTKVGSGATSVGIDGTSVSSAGSKWDYIVTDNPDDIDTFTMYGCQFSGCNQVKLGDETNSLGQTGDTVELVDCTFQGLDFPLIKNVGANTTLYVNNKIVSNTNIMAIDLQDESDINSSEFALVQSKSFSYNANDASTITLTDHVFEDTESTDPYVVALTPTTGNQVWDLVNCLDVAGGRISVTNQAEIAFGLPTRIGTEDLLTQTDVTALSQSYTLVAGLSRIVIWTSVYGDTGSGGTTGTPTYGGNNMTNVIDQDFAGSNLHLEVWYILEANLPADGANTLSASYVESQSAVSHSIETYDWVESVGASNATNLSDDASPSNSITPNTLGSLILSRMGFNSVTSVIEADEGQFDFKEIFVTNSVTGRLGKSDKVAESTSSITLGYQNPVATTADFVFGLIELQKYDASGDTDEVNERFNVNWTVTEPDGTAIQDARAKIIETAPSLAISNQDDTSAGGTVTATYLRALYEASGIETLTTTTHTPNAFKVYKYGKLPFVGSATIDNIVNQNVAMLVDTFQVESNPATAITLGDTTNNVTLFDERTSTDTINLIKYTGGSGTLTAGQTLGTDANSYEAIVEEIIQGDSTAGTIVLRYSAGVVFSDVAQTLDNSGGGWTATYDTVYGVKKYDFGIDADTLTAQELYDYQNAKLDEATLDTGNNFDDLIMWGRADQAIPIQGSGTKFLTVRNNSTEQEGWIIWGLGGTGLSAIESYQANDGTLFIPDTLVTIDIQVLDEDRNNFQDAHVFFEIVTLDPETTVEELINEKTPASGNVTDTYAHTVDVSARFRVRESSGATRYKDVSRLVTVTDQGFTAEVVMERQTILEGQ